MLKKIYKHNDNHHNLLEMAMVFFSNLPQHGAAKIGKMQLSPGKLKHNRV